MKNAGLAFGLLIVMAGARSDVAATQTERRPAPGSVDCIAYEPSGLKLTPVKDDIWMLERTDGAKFRMFANRADAEAGLAIFKEHSALCYIGRGNTFPAPYRSDYIMEFLRK